MAGSDLAPGTDLGGFRIERTLGRGGMGTVYLATQRSLDRPVALKVLHPARTRDPRSTMAFFDEARTAARLRHPNLVPIHEVVAEPARDIYAYAMEYVPGPTAARLVAMHGPLDRDAAFAVAVQVADALAAAHAAGLVHRDVKPDNLILDPAGPVRLLDLGLAYNRLGGSVASGGSRRFALVGTPEFAAPEQLRTPDAAGPASDVYSLGATLFALRTGRPPFSGATLIDLVVNICCADPVFPDGLDAPTRELLRTLFDKDPEERPRDGAAAVAAIRAAQQGRSPTAAPRQHRPRRLHR